MSEITTDKSTMDTLIYFIFGFTLDEDIETILSRVINKAFIDATNQGAFNTLDKEWNTECSDPKEETINIISNMIKKRYISKELHNMEFKEWHSKTCEKILEKYKGVTIKGEETNAFSYGNAQKALNMSLKYLYILSSINGYDVKDEIKNLFEAIKGESKELNIPIDSYILDALFRKPKTGNSVIPSTDLDLYKLGDSKKLLRKKELSMVKYPSNYLIGWSKWDSKCGYNALVNKIFNSIEEPIKWEETQWINESKKHRKDNKKQMNK